MISVYIPDVGDGLAVGVRMLDGTVAQIDCGSQHHAKTAFCKGLCQIDPNTFILSHFHADHYNGLFHAQCSRRRFFIRQVLYPRIPDFAERETFLRYMMAMNHWLMGDDSGSMAYDFLNLISSINCEPFKYRSLFMGENVSIGEAQYEVLWPPERIDESSSTLKVIKKAIKDFNVAVEENESLRRILENISERGEVSRYLETEEREVEVPSGGKSNESSDSLTCPSVRNPLPRSVCKANASLRKAANHLSLALHEDNKFLFMGDLEEQEISKVVSTLVKKKRRYFFVTITPHHGTHWHEDFRHLHTVYAISSVGQRLCRFFSFKYLYISDVCLATRLNGDVELSSFLPMLSKLWRHWCTFL